MGAEAASAVLGVLCCGGRRIELCFEGLDLALECLYFPVVV